MIFEYDQNKSVANEAKHGINFEQAQEIWKDQLRAELETNVQEEEQEERILTVGRIDNRYWTAVWTPRGEDGEIIRLISVRRARDKELKSYEENDISSRI